MTEFVAPDYGRRSLADVLPAVSHALGVDAGMPDPGLALPEAPGYVVFLVDGLGYELLRDHPEEAPFLAAHLDGPVTAGVPTTTATSLTSFGTGLVPGSHGVVGFTTRIPGTNDLLNALMWSSKVDPHEWQPHPTAFARLAAAGVHTTVVNKRDFRNSGLTVAGSRGAEFVGADRVGERLAAAQAAAAQQPSLTYLYDGDLDWTGHRYGVDSPQWEQQLSMIDAAAEHLRDTLPPEVRVVIVADHGMVDSPPESRVDTDDEPCSSSTGWATSCCAAARPGCVTCTAAPAPSTTWSPPGGACSGSAPTCSRATRRSRVAGSATPSPPPYDLGSATSSSPPAATTR